MGSRRNKYGHSDGDDPMQGEKFADMYERLEEDMGGEPFMPSYAYDARDEQVENLERLLSKKNYKTLGGTKDDFKASVSKKLKRAKKYAEGGLVPGKRKIARGCGKIMGNRRKKTLYT